MAVGGTQEDRQRDSLAVDDQMAFTAWLAFIRWIRTGLFAPLFAGIEALSRQARDQSIRSASPKRFNSA